MNKCLSCKKGMSKKSVLSYPDGSVKRYWLCSDCLGKSGLTKYQLLNGWLE